MTMTLTIGNLAKQAGVHVETIRFYQRRGLLREPPKPVSGFRVYPAEAVDRVRFIKRAQELGLTLNEVANLLRLGDGHCAETREMAQQKIAVLEAKIADLAALRQVLMDLVKRCETETTGTCPIVVSLSDASCPPDAHPTSRDP